MRARPLKVITAIAALSLAALPIGAAYAREPVSVGSATCDSGSTARLTIVNQCADSVWAVITSPGTPAQVAVRAPPPRASTCAQQALTQDREGA